MLSEFELVLLSSPLRGGVEGGGEPHVLRSWQTPTLVPSPQGGGRPEYEAFAC